MNTNENKISHSTPEQMAAAEALLKGSTLSLEDEASSKDGIAHFGGELNTHLMAEKKASAPGPMKTNPFDEMGIHVADDAQVKKAEEMLKDSGLTLQ
ncbi:MAG: hypothetical protein M0P64_02210 [Candidatus Pacebacteria bacterium]|nr:hypothetical protein [Candidatus Paceibacterota bacterium]